MNFKSQGLFTSIIILISLMLICHTANFLYPRNQINSNSFSNLPLSIPNNAVPVEYNKIYFDYNDNNKQTDCRLKNQAQIPCKVVASCTPTSSPTPTKYQLSDSELAVLYRDMYASAGREILLRTLNEQEKLYAINQYNQYNDYDDY